MPVDVDLRAEIRRQIHADYGTHTMMPGNRMPRPRRLPTRSLALDYVTGGGWPFRNMSRLWGGFSSTKSLTILNAFWSAQNFGELRYQRLKWLSEQSVAIGDLREAKKLMEQAKREREIGALKCMYVNSEGVWDQEYVARRIGLKLDEEHFELVMPPAAKRIEVLGDIVQKALAGYHVIGVDSTSSGISLEELGHKDGIAGHSETVPMRRAAKWGNNLAWWADRMTEDNVILYSSQIRSKIGMSSRQKVASEHAPGGNQLEHDSSCTLHFMKGGWLKRKDGRLVPMSDEATGGGDTGAFGKSQSAGSEIIVRCEKNRFGKSHRTVLLHHDKTYARFDSLHEYEKLAKYFQIVRRTGEGSSWYELPDGSKSQGLRQVIEESPDLARRIEDVTIRCAEDPEWEEKLLRGQGGPGEALVEEVA